MRNLRLGLARSQTVVRGALALCATGLLQSLAEADTHFVALSGSHQPPYTNWVSAATNIQAGINAASPGDEVLVAAGIYSHQTELRVTNGITLASLSGADVTIVDAGHVARGLYVTASDAEVHGFTFRHGVTHGDSNIDSSFGGGVYAVAGYVHGCHVVSNGGYAAGGVAGEGNAIISNCYIAYNSSGVGSGGASLWGGGVLRDCIVEHNTSSLGGGGVGIGSGSSIIDCIVRDNDPGGLGLMYESSAIGCSIVNNPGGGLGLLGGGNIASNCVVRNNGFAGVWFSGDQDVFINCAVLDNDGPGIVFAGDTNSLLQSTIAGNQTGVVFSAGRTYVRNSIIAGNGLTDWIDAGGASFISYTCTTPLPPGIGNITNDPQLTPSYRLKSTSPCIDAGTWSNAPATDIDGEARWDHPGHPNIMSIVDMGADEFVDTDSDDMADHWEPETFDSATNSNGTADDDNDDLDDLGEYENSTDPGNPDTDADTMPDGWEVGNDLDPLADDASQDPDDDTMNNGGEYVADTDPRDPESVLAVVNVTPERGGTRIDWKGGRAAWQFLDFRPSLSTTGTGWRALLAIPPPTPVTNAIVDLSTTNGVIFYRIRASR